MLFFNNIIFENKNHSTSIKTRHRVEVFIIKDKKILVGLGYGGKGRPSLPGGGIEPNEPLEKAARRETLEEVGVEFKFIKTMKTYVVDYSEARRKYSSISEEVSRWSADRGVCHPVLGEFEKINKELLNSEKDGRKYKFLTSAQAIRKFEIWSKKEPWNASSYQAKIKLINLLSKDGYID